MGQLVQSGVTPEVWGCNDLKKSDAKTLNEEQCKECSEGMTKRKESVCAVRWRGGIVGVIIAPAVQLGPEDGLGHVVEDDGVIRGDGPLLGEPQPDGEGDQFGFPVIQEVAETEAWDEEGNYDQNSSHHSEQ